MLGNGYFFCYLGCKTLFINKDTLMRHYVNRHSGEDDTKDLKKWGINYDVLEFQAEDQKHRDNHHSVAINARRREFKAKMYEEGLKLADKMKTER